MASMRTVKVLRNALQLFDGGKNWAKGHYVARRNPEQPLLIEECRPGSPEAGVFCAIGAIQHASKLFGDSTPIEEREVRHFLEEAFREEFHYDGPERRHNFRGVEFCNDKPTTQFDQVAAAFNRAIEKAEQEVA